MTAYPPPRPEDRLSEADRITLGLPEDPTKAPPTTSSYKDLLLGAILLLPTAGLIYWFVQVAFEKLGV